MKIDTRLSAKLTNLLVVCTLLILLMHLSQAGVKSFCECSKPLLLLTRVAVPLFFAMSGFLVLKSFQGSIGVWYKNLLKKRFSSLVVPYLAINTLFIPWLIVYHNILKLGTWEGSGPGFDWYTISRIYGLTWRYHPVCGTMWYVRCLIIFMLLAPLFVIIIRRSKILAGLLLLAELGGIIWVENQSFYASWSNFFYSFINLRGILFFSLGIFLAFWGDECLFGICRFRRTLSLVGWFVLCTLPWAVHWPHSPEMLLLRLIVYAIALWLVMPAFSTPKWIASSCFAIYVLHENFYTIYKIAVSRLGIAMLNENVFLSVIPLVFALAGCFALTWFLRHFAPRVGAFFFGGRC